MKVSKKDAIIFILLAIIIATAVLAGHYKIKKDKMEAYVNQRFYMKFCYYFLEQNENLYEQFKPIFEGRHITNEELALINQSAKEMVAFAQELIDYYYAFYGSSENSLQRSGEYLQFMDTVIGWQTYKMLKNGDEYADSLVDYFDHIQLEEKLRLIKKAIQEFRDQHAAYLEDPLTNPAGKSFIKAPYWQRLLEELNDRLIHTYRYINP